jgi:hypothetical protein
VYLEPSQLPALGFPVEGDRPSTRRRAVFFGIGAIDALLWGRRDGIEARGLSLDAAAPVAMTV